MATKNNDTKKQTPVDEKRKLWLADTIFNEWKEMPMYQDWQAGWNKSKRNDWKKKGKSIDGENACFRVIFDKNGIKEAIAQIFGEDEDQEWSFDQLFEHPNILQWNWEARAAQDLEEFDTKTYPPYIKKTF
jgi:hypothetical protein